MEENKMSLKVAVVGMVSTNCYVVANNQNNEIIIVDPGDDIEVINEQVERIHGTVKGILLTHGHFDHIMAVNELAAQHHVKIYAHSIEKELLADPGLNCSQDIGRPYIVDLQETLEDNMTFTLAGFNIKVLHTPGHTAGSVCYLFEKEGVLFSGDTIFMESIGRTDLPTGNEGKLLVSIQTKLMELKDDIKVFPGHGPSTSIGYEKRNNMFFGR